MKWIDSIMNHLGYERKAQIQNQKPTTNPQQIPNQNPLLTNDENIDPSNSYSPNVPMQGGQPENLVGPQAGGGNPNAPNPGLGGPPSPNVNINENSVTTQVPNDFTQPEVNDGVPKSSEPINPVPNQMKTHYTIDEMDTFHPKLSQMARKLGIKTVDKEEFDKTYQQHVKIAVLHRKSLSDYFDELCS